MTSFLLKCLSQAQGNNLFAYYAYYVMENIHGLVGLHKRYTTWQMDVCKKVFQCFNLFSKMS